MQAINAPLRPEVQKDDFASKVGSYGNRAFDVEPVKAIGNVGRRYFSLVPEIVRFRQ
jgi:hypothetical protein